MKKLIIYTILIPALILTTACDDEYLERLPLDSPSSETYFANETELEMAVTGVYNRLWYFPAGIAWFLSFDFASDDGWDRNGSTLQALGRGEQNADNGFTNGFWSHFYRGINRVNYITSKSIELRQKMDPDDYDRLVGEARFLRAFFYSYLAELYGDVPLITSTLTLEDSQTPRASKEAVIDFVLSELDEVKNYLPMNASDKGRVTKGVVLALISRVALWNERWEVSASAAKELIDSGAYQIDPDYQGMFTFAGDNSPEVIMRIQYLRGVATHNMPRNFWSRMALGHSNKKPPQDMVDTYHCIDGLPIDESPLYKPNSPFENRDPRLGHTLVLPGSRLVNWIYETHRDSTMTWEFRGDEMIRVPNIEAQHAYASFTGYLYRKHVDVANYPTDVGSSDQNLTIFRLGEVLLNYVEAKVELNQLDESVYEAINAIRSRESVQMPLLEAGKTQGELRNIVRKERRHELGMEGFRYFDIRRWRIAEDVIPGPVRGRVNRYGEGGWLNSAPMIDEMGTPSYDNISNASEMVVVETRAFNPERDYLWPIPRIELETNTALTQNPGY
ncbi:MAG: RagB/SusD family nutrient uptake outer membrane protein [Cytophagales bacterium]|uniref:RagB/SusD family nutrient uptake outer membrane protein n=1 Tax=Cyclobacterium marinum TaxID=104 RepID=UPI001659590E|nr:RagB/SusD family nutrient uptake outer membrane protein [Cyclobacterium marinum]MBI0398564.1 RagB/SusD family nutrient uptake outer membrane protein [Cyclobacterium marinum]MBR9775201.1 RagB/SusD family nutrient uptake outer membrane protein [Cytophagales bacterium]